MKSSHIIYIVTNTRFPIYLMTSLWAFSFWVSCVDDSQTSSVGLLPNGEIRGEVIKLDANKSSVTVKALQMGVDLEEIFKNSSKSDLELSH